MKFLERITVYISKKVNLLIESILSPQVLSILLPIILGAFYHQNIIDTITNTQAKILLQKERLDPLQYQITETWIATSALLFLLDKYSTSENIKNQRENPEIRKSFRYWKNITNNWKNEWQDKFDDNFKEIKTNRRKLQKQFDNIVNYFEGEFFNRLSVCYNNYYSKSKSCITPIRTLPLPANATEFQNKIYQFYVNSSKTKKK